MSGAATTISSSRAPQRSVQPPTSHVSPGRIASEIVTCCAQTDMESNQRSRVRKLARQYAIDWQQVLDLAGLHRVHPLVGRNLKQLVAARLPAQVHERIDHFDRVASIHNTFLLEELGRLQRWFEEQGIPSLALKGPGLAKVAYGDVHLRQYSDIDLLIPPEHFDTAERMLLQGDYEHYRKLKNIGGLRKRFYLYLSQQSPFKRGNGVFTLDLHTRIMPPGYRYPVRFDALWERARRIDLGSVEVWGCAQEDMLHLLCFHGIKNQWRVLKHVCDVAELIRACPDMDWKGVIARAEEGRFQHVLSLGLCLAHKTFGVDLPSSVQTYAEQDEAVRAAADKLIQVLQERGEGRELSYRERVEVLFAALHSMPNKLRYVAYSALRNTWAALLQSD